MTLVTAAAVMAGVLDTEELQALVILLASARHGRKFIAATALERGCGTTLVSCGPAATPPTPAAFFARTAFARTAFARTA
jgi:hypothetical protein